MVSIRGFLLLLTTLYLVFLETDAHKAHGVEPCVVNNELILVFINNELIFVFINDGLIFIFINDGLMFVLINDQFILVLICVTPQIDVVGVDHDHTSIIVSLVITHRVGEISVLEHKLY